MRRGSAHGLENDGRYSSTLTLNDGEEVGDGAEGARGGRPLAKALDDRGHHPLQPLNVRLRCVG